MASYRSRCSEPAWAIVRACTAGPCRADSTARREQCVHRHRFETLQHAGRAIADWIQFYNHRRPHQALKMKTPAEAFALAA
ncbi:integrase core domain-containing protein [Paraburkholderia lycopersici]|uniref:integrase core domain-containing protein n=1 Tax=Paraburkholderia lycopersici TaxID=416944 RepID=UPI001FE06648|nr:integrase core domain-containing protein [Paraburkholderia lycopersici]